MTTAIINGYHKEQAQILPKEDVALIVWGDKVTGDISGPLRFHASKAVARKYHIHQQKKAKWKPEQFEEVDWEHLDLALKSKADKYRIAIKADFWFLWNKSASRPLLQRDVPRQAMSQLLC